MTSLSQIWMSSSLQKSITLSSGLNFHFSSFHTQICKCILNPSDGDKAKFFEELGCHKKRLAYVLVRAKKYLYFLTLNMKFR